MHLIGREVGETRVTVSDAKNSLTVPVQVAKYAMQLDEPVTATVTGNPPSEFATESAVAAAVQAAIHPEPGANCDIFTGECNVDNLYPGCTTQVPVRIVAEGSGYLPYRGRPAVTVMNRSIALSPVSLLMVSNSPEKLRGYGLWYEALLSDWQSARLLYHHVNATSESALLVVELWNLGDQPARVHITAGLGGPSFDELWVGHRATAEYMRSSSRGAGWVVSIPAGTVMTIFSHTMPRGSVVSGLAEFRALGPAKLSVRVSLEAPATPTGLRPVEHYAPAPMLGECEYPDPQRHLKARVRGRGQLGLRYHRRPAGSRDQRRGPVARVVRRDARSEGGDGQLHQRGGADVNSVGAGRGSGAGLLAGGWAGGADAGDAHE